MIAGYPVFWGDPGADKSGPRRGAAHLPPIFRGLGLHQRASILI